ncbi:hypothetical protein [Cellulomonas chengniuliangii]|uniref:Uncharacterized protein n=1 Tax=Cellulomonas chengniuliangii TaxID=2968084 RepID=A0ABY5KW04_9CELL|nr:hypothetical protein [Cellulomonas chengniuliangii]MCC2308487.1 hypothetical protein [Cellulomonas chengniuliangii]UUI73854.1 hypothetical protein NP064_08310 [Cellulomonas chengniuliangii]
MTIPEPLDPDAAPDRPAQEPIPDEDTPDEAGPGSEPPDQHAVGPYPGRRSDGGDDLAADGRPLAEPSSLDVDGA